MLLAWFRQTLIPSGNRHNIVALCLVAFLLGGPTGAAAHPVQDRAIEQSFEFGADATMRVDNPSGKVSIEVWGEDLIHVIAEKRKSSRAAIGTSDVSFFKTRSQMTVTCQPQKIGDEIDLKIYVPRRLHLRVHSQTGSVDIAGPVASATVETETGDILFETPTSQDAELSLSSQSGSVSAGLSVSLYGTRTPRSLQGKLGQGGAPIVLRSVGGNVTVQPLRPQLAKLIAPTSPDTSAGPSPVPGLARQSGSDPANPSSGYADIFGVDRTNQGSNRTVTNGNGGTQSQNSAEDANGRLRVRVNPPAGSAPTTPAADDVLGPNDSTKSGSGGGNRPLTDVFGSNQDTQGSNRSTGQTNGGFGTGSQKSDGSTGTSGGFGVRIIPPPVSTPPGDSPRPSPSAPRDYPPSYDPNLTAPRSTGSLRGRPSTTPAADDVLASLPKTDPRVVQPNDDGSPGASSAPPDADDADAIKMDTKLVNLNITVTNRSGRAITDLKATDFSIFQDDVKQEVAHFVPVTTPFNLVLLLDLSGSTRDKIDTIKQTALRFIAATNPRDKVAVVAFTRGVQVVCRPTSDRELLKQRIRDMRRTDGGTAFYEAMWFVLSEVLGGFNGERNAIVVMTDGVDNALSSAYPAPSRISFRQMIDRVLESGTLVYPIYLDTESENYQQQWGEPAEVYAQARTQLKQLAEASGGVLFISPRVEELGNVYEKVAAELRTIYSLGYYPSTFERDGQWHRIRVKISQPEAAIRTRKGFYAK